MVDSWLLLLVILPEELTMIDNDPMIVVDQCPRFQAPPTTTSHRHDCPSFTISDHCEAYLNLPLWTILCCHHQHDLPHDPPHDPPLTHRLPWTSATVQVYMLVLCISRTFALSTKDRKSSAASCRAGWIRGGRPWLAAANSGLFLFAVTMISRLSWSTMICNRSAMVSRMVSRLSWCWRIVVIVYLPGWKPTILTGREYVLHSHAIVVLAFMLLSQGLHLLVHSWLPHCLYWKNMHSFA